MKNKKQTGLAATVAGPMRSLATAARFAGGRTVGLSIGKGGQGRCPPRLDTNNGERKAAWAKGRLLTRFLKSVAIYTGAIALVVKAGAAEARLTSTELATEMATVVQQLQGIAAGATTVSNTVAGLRAEADRYFTQSTNTALPLIERNRAFALGLDKLTDAVIENEKFIRAKGRTLSDVKARLGDITGSAGALNPVALPKIDFEKLAVEMRRADDSLGDLLVDEDVSPEVAEAFSAARDAAMDDQGFSNDVLPKFVTELRQLSRQVAKEEFTVAQNSLVNRRLFAWIAIKSMQGQLNLANSGNPLPSVSPKDAGWGGTLAKFSPPKAGSTGASGADERPRRVSADSILKR